MVLVGGTMDRGVFVRSVLHDIVTKARCNSLVVSIHLSDCYEYYFVVFNCFTSRSMHKIANDIADILELVVPESIFCNAVWDNLVPKKTFVTYVTVIFGDNIACVRLKYRSGITLLCWPLFHVRGIGPDKPMTINYKRSNCENTWSRRFSS